VERRGPRRIRSTNNSSFFHGGELLLGGCQLLRIKPSRFRENRRTRLREQMVSNTMMRFRGRETVGGNYIRELGEKVRDTLRGSKKVGFERS
jgi:hypothetical protein